MSDADDDAGTVLDDDAEAVATSAATDRDAFLDVLPHFYRGEVAQASAAQDRIDRTTDWAIALIAALLSLVFSSPSMPAYLLLIGLLVLSVFLGFEIRRYRFYDVWRSRVRLVQEQVFAEVFDPTTDDPPPWREQLGEDLREPTFKVSAFEAASRRIRRVYGPLFTLVGIAWVAKVTLFTPEFRWTEAAELPGVPGTVVAAGVGAFYLVVALVAYWPQEREAKGEIHGVESGDWKREEGKEEA